MSVVLAVLGVVVGTASPGGPTRFYLVVVAPRLRRGKLNTNKLILSF